MKFLMSSIPKKEAKLKVKSIFLNLDREKSGKIYYSQFVEAVMDEKQLFSEQNLQSSFKKIDLKQKGFIHEKDILNLLP